MNNLKLICIKTTMDRCRRCTEVVIEEALQCVCFITHNRVWYRGYYGFVRIFVEYKRYDGHINYFVNLHETTCWADLCMAVHLKDGGYVKFAILSYSLWTSSSVFLKSLLWENGLHRPTFTQSPSWFSDFWKNFGPNFQPISSNVCPK